MISRTKGKQYRTDVKQKKIVRHCTVKKPTYCIYMSADINPEMNKEKRKTAFKREWIFNMKINVTLGYNNSSNVGTLSFFFFFFTLSIFYFSICNSYTCCTLRDFPIHASLSDTPPLTFAGSHRAR